MVGIALPNYLAIFAGVLSIDVHLCLVVCAHRENSSLHEAPARTLVIMREIDDWNSVVLR